MGVIIFPFLSVFYGIQKRSQSKRVSRGTERAKPVTVYVGGWYYITKWRGSDTITRRILYTQHKRLMYRRKLKPATWKELFPCFFLFCLFLNFPSSGRNYFTCLLLYEIKYIRSYCIPLYYGWICFLKNCFICLINWIKYSYYDIDVK